MNQVMIAGHLGADPEVRFTSSGQKVTTLRVAARARRGKEDATIWWRVNVWGEQFDPMMPYFKKGGAIMVSGDLNKPEIFTDREGKPQVSMSITANSLLFSPFGKPASAHTSEAAPHAATTPEAAFSPAAEQLAMQGSGVQAGQGKVDLGFGEEEIPF